MKSNQFLQTALLCLILGHLTTDMFIRGLLILAAFVFVVYAFLLISKDDL